MVRFRSELPEPGKLGQAISHLNVENSGFGNDFNFIAGGNNEFISCKRCFVFWKFVTDSLSCGYDKFKSVILVLSQINFYFLFGLGYTFNG